MMRIILGSLAFLFGMGFSMSQDEIHFQKLTLDEAKVKSIAENKDIFIDFRADWCKPCIAMEKYTFTDPQVAQAVNSRFISIKADVDYFEAMDMQELYNVSVLPTILIINSSGVVQRRIIGEKTPAKLLAELNLIYHDDGGQDGNEVDIPASNEQATDKKRCFLRRWFSRN